MLPREYELQVCSIARTLETVGERWTVLILRDIFLGLRRFSDLQEELGIARNVLSKRLDGLVAEGILQRVRYQERPERFEYRLTDKGRDLWPVVMTLMEWGDKYEAPDGPPTLVEHRDCGGRVNGRMRCERCGADVDVRQVTARPGPGAGAKRIAAHRERSAA
jgi:DNA-binding HxlR family transcriptional regulator